MSLFIYLFRDQQIHVLVDQSCSEASALLNALKRSPPSETKLKKAYIKRNTDKKSIYT